MNTSIQGNSDSQPSTSWPRRLAILACLTVGCVFSFRAMTSDVAAKVTLETSSVAEIRTTAVLPTANDANVKLVTKSIEDIQLGQRVVGRNPLRHETQAPSEIDPATWRAVRLNMIQNGVEFDLAFLRPLSWLKSTGAVVGGSIPMELHEMGLNGPARVVGIDPCPFIEPDDGTGRNVVTGTMAHPGANLVYLDITGLDEPLGVTDTHPIWSETRQDFVVAGQLEIGEQFRTVTGQSATLTRIHPHRGPPEMVFNLEVDAQHVYHVAGSGLLVHNVCPWEVGPYNSLKNNSDPFDGLDIHHAGQKHPMSQLVPGYDPKTGASIAVPQHLHVQIPTRTGTVGGTARDQLAKDIWDLRGVGAPNSALRELIELNKSMYPGAF
jgi:hypothetical protein